MHSNQAGSYSSLYSDHTRTTHVLFSSDFSVCDWLLPPCLTYTSNTLTKPQNNLITQNFRQQSCWQPSLRVEVSYSISVMLILNRQMLSPCPQAQFLLDTDKSQSQLLLLAWKDKSLRRLKSSPKSNLHLVGSRKEYDNPDVTSISKCSSYPSCLLPRLDRGYRGYKWSTSLWLFR